MRATAAVGPFLFPALPPRRLSAAAADDLPANRRLAAEACPDLCPLDAMMVDATGKILKVMPREHREGSRDIMKSSMDRTDPELATDALVQHYAAKEIHAMMDVHDSPEGLPVTGKFPGGAKEAMPTGMEIVSEAVTSFEGGMRG